MGDETDKEERDNTTSEEDNTSDEDEDSTEENEENPAKCKKKNKSKEEKKMEEYKRRLKKAKKLIREAKRMREAAESDNEELLRAKMDEIKDQLELPGDWKDVQTVDFDKLIKDIENEVNLASNGLELKPFDKLEDLVAAVSGGMVRYGLLYPTHNWKDPDMKRGQFPVLQYPKIVENLQPQLASKTEFYKSTATSASSKFVQKVESSGLSVATSVSANYLFVSGSATVSNSNENSEESKKTKKTSSTEATVIKYKGYPIKAFRVPKSEMKLTTEADCDIKKVSNIYDAKRVLDKYGSHIPAGVHHLGGIFCDVIDIKSEEEEHEESLTTAASNQFSSEVSVGGQGLSFGCAVSGSVKISRSKGQTDAQHKKETNATYTRNIKCFGPDSTNIEMFSKIVEANNATWRIIDRGDLATKVSLWDLIKDLGDEYINPAYLIEEAWKNYHNIPDETVKLIEDIRSFVAAKLTLNWNSDSITIMNEIMLEIEKVQQQIGDHCSITAEVLRIQKFSEFLKAVIKSNQPAKAMIRQMLKPEVYAKIKGTVTLDKEIEDFVVNKAMLRSISESEVVESVLLHDIPAVLNSLFVELNEYNIDSETCKSKIASILTNAKVEETEKELYGAVIQKAKEFGYQPDRLSFTDSFDAGNLKDLAECLDKLLNAKFARGNNVRFEFKTKERDLGWKKGVPHRIEVTGKVERVEGNHAYVEWQKLDNLSLSVTESTLNLVKGSSPESICSKWLGYKKDPEMHTGLKYKMPFWELKHEYLFSDVQQHARTASEALAWKETRLNEEKLSFPDLCVDHPPLFGNEDSVDRVVDALKHRTDVFSKWAGTQVDSDSSDDDYSDNDDEIDQQEKVLGLTKPFCVLLKLLGKCNLSGKQEVFRKLFDQRYSVPLIYRNTDTDELIYLVNSLRFVDAKLRNKSVGLMEDKTLPRVVFISERSENLSQSLHMTKEIFKCNMGSHDCNVGLMAELSVGFLSSGEKASSSERDPWLVLHVKGDYLLLKDFIQKFADFIVFEVEGYQHFSDKNLEEFLSEGKPVLKWKITNEKLRSNSKKMTISGSFHDVASKMENYLVKLTKKENLARNTRNTLSDIHVDNIKRIDEITGLASLAARIQKIGFLTVRDSLELQKSYTQECEYKLNMQRIREDSMMTTSYQIKIEEEFEKRRERASDQTSLPILAEFLAVLQTEDQDLRIVALNQFDKILNEESGKVLMNEKKRVNDAWDHYRSLINQPEGESALKKYYDAKLAYANKNVAIEHLWRELSHVYVTQPLKYKNLPDLAAQHMLDGFVFEILDGDARIVNGEWMKAVLVCLNKKLQKKLGRDPNVFVLSVMGTQSTGKSTLLNTMFGCRLKVSAGQCTRGINLQLVKTEKRTGEFDYVLVMDTEGLRSPEFFGTDGAIWRDNRLATFSILPADATIITTVNEEDAAIKEVLPIVMLAFKGSIIAEEISGRLRSMMFFVYSRVDTSKQAVEKFDYNRRNLQSELQEAVIKIEKFQIAGEGAVNIHDEILSPKGPASMKIEKLNILGDGAVQRDHESTLAHESPSDKILNKFLRNFQVDDDEKKSDVKYLGLLNKGMNPPDDTPDFDFGQKIANLREYMFERLTQNDFQGQTLNNWSGYFDLVCQCIDATDFELNFKTAVEFQAFNQLKSSIDCSRQKVSKRYSTEYKTCEDEIFNVQAGGKLDLDALKQRLHTAAQETILQEEKNVRELLNKDVNKRFKTDETSNWNSFIKDIKKTFENLLKDFYEAKFVYGDIVSRYEQKILDDLKDKYGKNPNALKNPSERETVFKDVFQKQLQMTKKEHPPIDVNENIDKEYASLNHVNTKLATRDQSYRNALSKFGSFFGCETETKKFNGICEEVVAHCAAELHSVTHYDATVVQEVIKFTENIISDKKIANKQKQSLLHAEMKHYLQARFTSIQNKWDEEHNIARKLENEEFTLRQKFDSICEGFIGRRAVAADIIRGIKAAIKNGFTEYLAEDAKGKVETKPWISKSEVMQAHIDLSLLSLSKQGKTRELLNAISSGSSYYEKILSKLILAEVDSESCWEILKQKLYEGIPQAAAVASTLEIGRHTKFISEINSRLKSSLKKHLPSTTWTDLLELKDTLTKDDFVEIGELVKKDFETTLSKPQVDDSRLAQNIKDQLKLEGLPDSQPRCSVSCPRCRMTCRKPASHVKEEGKTEAKHDCKHQPEGLAGIFFVEGYSRNPNGLVNESCDEAVKLGYKMRIDKKGIPYSKFEEVYDSWQLPNCTNVAKVRKYLFRKHQKELAKYYGKKECSEITGQYDLKTLESELEQIINE